MPEEYKIPNDICSLVIGSDGKSSSVSKYYHEIITVIIQCCARYTINAGQNEHTGMNFEVLKGIMSNIVEENRNNDRTNSVSIYASLQTLLAQCNHVLLNVNGNLSEVISILPIQVIVHQPCDQVSHCVLCVGR